MHFALRAAYYLIWFCTCQKRNKQRDSYRMVSNTTATEICSGELEHYNKTVYPCFCRLVALAEQFCRGKGKNSTGVLPWASHAVFEPFNLPFFAGSSSVAKLYHKISDSVSTRINNYMHVDIHVYYSITVLLKRNSYCWHTYSQSSSSTVALSKGDIFL